MPAAGRGLPGMPLAAEDADDDDFTQPRKRFAAPTRPWWRPTSTLGRALLAFAALVVVSAAAYALNVCRGFFEHDARFRIAGTSNIQATGLGQVSRADMLPVFGEDVGRNIFFVPLAERRKQLEQIPWVEHATVMRILPDQIRVSLVERKPVAFVRHGQQIGLVDANGVLLTMPAAMMAQHHYSFPVLTGIDGGDPLPSRKARVALYQRLIGELDAGGQHLSDQISEIDLTDPEDARVLMPEQGTDILAHFGEDHFLERYQRYKNHIAEWRQQYPKLAAVDLRYDQQVVLQMQRGGAAEQTAPLNSDNGKPATAKPSAAVPAETAKASPAKLSPVKSSTKASTKLAPKSGPAKTKSSSAKTSLAKTGAASKHVSGAKTTAHTTASAKARAARLKEKKRAEAKRAALNHKKPKPSARSHAPAGQGR